MKTTHHSDIMPLAVRGADAARLCGISPRLWRSLDAAGKVPLGRRLGRCKVWSVDELQRWMASGCPSRDRWHESRGQP